MSYTQARAAHRFSVLRRTTSATAAIGSTYPFQTGTSVPTYDPISGNTPKAGALCFGNMISSTVAYPPLVEFSLTGTSPYTGGGDMLPSQGASASNCEQCVGVASGSAALQLRVDAGYEVNDTILAACHALVLE